MRVTPASSSDALVILPTDAACTGPAKAFLSLCGEAKSQERMQFMLMNNKPLRN